MPEPAVAPPGTSPRRYAPVARRPSLAPAHFALAGAQAAFGLFPVFGQVVMQPGGLTPLGVAAWRVTVGAAALLALAFAVHGRGALPARRDLARFAVAAWCGVAVNQWLFLLGLSRSTPVNAALMTCLIPVFTVALATAVGLEAFSVSRLAGVLVALGGTLLLVLDRGFTTLGRYGFGNVLLVGNALFYSTFLIVSKPLLDRYSSLVAIAWAYALALPFVPLFAWRQPLAPEPGHLAAWWSLAYILAFPTVLAYLLNMYALARVRASTTAIYIYTQPFVAGIASWVAFRERPTAAMLLAAPLLFTGIWLVSRRESNTATRHG